MAEKLILANGVTRSTDTSKTGLNNNVLIIGGSGSGKTWSFVEPCLLETTQTSGIVPITKRRLVTKYTPYFQKNGAQVLDLNFVHPERSNVGYDPLSHCKTDADISFLADSIVYANTKKGSYNYDPFFDKAASSLLGAEIYLIKKTVFNASMSDVIDLHKRLEVNESRGSMIETSLDNLFDQFIKKYPNSYGASCWKTFRSLPIRTAGCVYSSLNTAIDQIFTPELLTMMRMDKLDFTELAKQRTILFITTSPVNPALNSFVNTFYSQAFKELFEFAQEQPDGKLPIPVKIICDDFATGSRILNFTEYISIIREVGLSVMLLLQSETQLASMYGADDAITIQNNCDTIVYTGGMDIQTAKTFSIRADLPIQDLLCMPVGRIMIFRRGERPIIDAERYDILHDKRNIALERQMEKSRDRDREHAA